MLGKSLLVFFAAALGAAGCSDGAGEGTAVQTSPLYNAPIDTDHPFDVGVCAGRLNTDPKYGEIGSCAGPGLGVPGGFNIRASGTLVAPNLVLTARHAFRKLEPPPPTPFDCSYGLGAMWFPEDGIRITTTHSTIVDQPTWIKVEKIIEPAGNFGCTDDLALLQLDHDIWDVEPAWVDLRHDLGTSPPRDGKLAVVGRGAVAPTDLGGLLRRYQRDMSFTCAKAPCELRYPFDGQTLSLQIRDGMIAFGAGLLGGDSGSGVLLNESFDTRPTVVGVSTISLRTEKGFPVHSVGIALHPHREWIARAAREAARAGHYRAPRWARDCADGTDGTDETALDDRP
ncbi:trypsin-like serine protease [Pendulispora albinea]|uniref:Trypsin-like serine protease n=1 Tax=Pendulispora albinea TaxID=2741071 RepID=A0ABZ2M1W8_9BACT